MSSLVEDYKPEASLCVSIRICVIFVFVDPWHSAKVQLYHSSAPVVPAVSDTHPIKDPQKIQIPSSSSPMGRFTHDGNLPSFLSFKKKVMLHCIVI